MSTNEKTIEIEVLRYRPEQDAAPFPQTWVVPYSDDMSVLQGLQYIKDHLDGTLSFRWSCRQAICGSCGVMIDGIPKLSCKSFLRDYAGKGRVRVEALANFPIERDLVIVMDSFVEKLESIKPYIIPKEPRPLSAGEYRQTPAQLDAYAQYSSCINCLLCYAACPQVGLSPDFVGPAALALLFRYNSDSRDGGAAQRMPVVGAESGAFHCTAVGYCSEVCPKGVDPASAVNQAKGASVREYFLGFLGKGGGK
ncbi:succinate dehydrogenase/fumarate reductase iron-sulfur subunit [Rhodocyclus tenuis]|uniref:Succinate dehydrogenase iron-sulfur subunit n=1 Tax=Rhodocyclus gracilis TaxID=2929842 RepID=A0ABX0WJI5_9RHOO|nr:succinate dehydrogenase/fumarate reductase iron-sulfur subunit [Rhodocyclus gracilis]NJA89717.1 succinate dehydrogenase/fumarate reductase iron-sulfur subunit [Rhodocyclus gracilis]